MRVAFFVFNTGNGDLRVHRQASLLAAHGYEVRVYCFLEPGLPAREERSGYLLVRQDQRTPLTRFFDDQVMRRLKRPRARVEEPAAPAPVERPPDRPPQRPCPEPGPRDLPARATAEERDYWNYVRRINGVWAGHASAWKPHVCQAHDLDALEGASEAARRCGARLVYDAHELWSEQPFITSQEAVAYWDALEARLIPEADAVLTVSEPFAEVLEQRYGVEVEAIHNCQEYQPLKPGTARAEPLALYQGVYGVDRGLEELVESARYQDQVTVALRGYGEREPALRALAEGLEHVVFLEPCPAAEIVTRAGEADLGVIPFLPSCLNHYLNTPNKLFEFMMAGLPIVAADLPDLRRFVQDQEIGVLVDPRSPRDLARGIVELATHPQREAMGRRAHELARTRYHWEAEGKKLLEVYARLTRAGNDANDSVA